MDQDKQAAMEHHIGLLQRYQALLLEVSAPANVLPPGVVLRNKVIILGLPVLVAVGLYVALSSWLWAGLGLVVGLVLGFVLVATITPNVTPRLGTLGFEADQEIAIAIRMLRPHIDRSPDGMSLSELQDNNGAIEHFMAEIAKRKNDVGSMEPGKSSISVPPYPRQ